MRGSGGPKKFKEIYEAQLEFPEGWRYGYFLELHIVSGLHMYKLGAILYFLLETRKPSVSSLAVCYHGAPLLPPVKRRIPGNIGKAILSHFSRLESEQSTLRSLMFSSC